MWSDLKFRVRALFRRGAMDRELADELGFHLERQIEKYVRAGMPRREAERRARVEFGGIEQIAEDARAIRGISRPDALLQDVRYAWRGVRARPGFAAAVVLTLGLGMGATATMFGIVDRLLMRLPSYLESPDRVHRVYMNFTWDGRERSDRGFAYLTYQDLQKYTTTLDAHATLFYSTNPVGSAPDVRELPVLNRECIAVRFLRHASRARPVLHGAGGCAAEWSELHANVANTLKTGVHGSTHRDSRLQTSLLLLQSGLCVVLLVGAGLFVRSLLNVRSIPLGYDADSLVLVDADMRGLELNAPERNELVERMRTTAVSVPGVRAATLRASVALAGSEGRGAPHVPGRDSLNLLGRYTLQTGSPEYFVTMGTRILKGRGFEPTDVRGSPPIVIISKGMADAIWPGGDPLGRQMRFGPDSMPMLTVVGVAEDVVNRQINGPSDFWYYLPFEQYQSIFDASIRPALIVRVQGEPERFIELLRERLQREMTGDAYVRVASFANLLERQIRPWRAGATMFVIFAGLALVLATIGLYSVVAYGVAQRTRELGLRIALGASVGNVVGTVVRRGVIFALIGIVAGGGVALFAARRIEPLLFRVSPRDPLIFGGVAVILLLTAAAATLRPALRASRVDPTIALRAE